MNRYGWKQKRTAAWWFSRTIILHKLPWKYAPSPKRKTVGLNYFKDIRNLISGKGNTRNTWQQTRGGWINYACHSMKKFTLQRIRWSPISKENYLTIKTDYFLWDTWKYPKRTLGGRGVAMQRRAIMAIREKQNSSRKHLTFSTHIPDKLQDISYKWRKKMTSNWNWCNSSWNIQWNKLKKRTTLWSPNCTSA